MKLKKFIEDLTTEGLSLNQPGGLLNVEIEFATRDGDAPILSIYTDGFNTVAVDVGEEADTSVIDARLNL